MLYEDLSIIPTSSRPPPPWPRRRPRSAPASRSRCPRWGCPGRPPRTAGSDQRAELSCSNCNQFSHRVALNRLSLSLKFAFAFTSMFPKYLQKSWTQSCSCRRSKGTSGWSSDRTPSSWWWWPGGCPRRRRWPGRGCPRGRPVNDVWRGLKILKLGHLSTSCLQCRPTN